MIVLLAALLFSACSEPEIAPDDEDDDDEPLVITPAEADELLERLLFTGSTRVTGPLPSVSNTAVVKNNVKDTIYAMPGVQLPIRLYHSQTGKIKGWYIGVTNSSFYYDVPVEETEAGDSITIIFPEVPESDEAYSMPLKIIPYDESNQPVDIVEREFTVELPDDGCGLLVKPGNNFEWIWNYTYSADPNNKRTFFNFPQRVFATESNPTGCCNSQAACPAYVCDPNTLQCNWVYNSEVTMKTIYSIDAEFLTLYDDGTFFRYTDEHKQNFDPIQTDWCGRIPAYTITDQIVQYEGTHNYVPGRPSMSLTTTSKECDPPDPFGLCGLSTSLLSGEVKVNCHLLVIIRNRLNIDFTKDVIAFTRHPGQLDPEINAILYP